MRFLLETTLADQVDILTPSEPTLSGCQLSLAIKLNAEDKPERGKEVFNAIEAKGVTGDWRYPNVIRVAPVPQYNSFEDAYHFVQILKSALN